MGVQKWSDRQWILFKFFYKENKIKKIRGSMGNFGYNWSNWKKLDFEGVDCKNWNFGVWIEKYSQL